MSQPVTPVKNKRKLVLLLSGFLAVAVLGSALAFSFNAGQSAHAAASGPTKSQIIAIIKKAFGSGSLGTQAVSVATCESSLNPKAYNPAPPYAMGLFQIAKGTWAEKGIGKGDPYNATDNAQAARRLYDRRGWSPWACKPNTSSSCPATIEKGRSGSLVVTLQTKLNELYAKKVFPNSPYNFHPPLVKDGKFGDNVRYAVMDLQKKKGLLIDGVVGPRTWHALGKC